MKAIRNFLDKIDPELMIQESMYGFVMSLTFITAAQLGIFHYSDRTALILAIIGMDFVWGSIDMYIFYRMDMMSLHRQVITLGKMYVSEDRSSMREEVDRELDGTIFDLMDGSTREKAVDLVMGSEIGNFGGYRKEKNKYLFNAVSAAIITFMTAIPAVACLLLIGDDTTAFFSSSAISSLALFFIGYRMSPYRKRSMKALTGLVTTAASLLLTLFAAYFGG